MMVIFLVTVILLTKPNNLNRSGKQTSWSLFCVIWILVELGKMRRRRRELWMLSKIEGINMNRGRLGRTRTS